MKRYSLRSIIIVCTMLLTMLIPIQHASADNSVVMLTNGAFYTQTSKQPGYGFAITDEGSDSRGQMIRMWSEFLRLGGVDKLGYPASQRFMWNGFVCQATQRVILQWHPETQSVAFINVFDLASMAGKDSYLEAVRQVPKPAQYNDSGKTFQQVTNERLALLTRPAIRSAYMSLGAAAIDLNGLPVAPVTDMGDAYVLRAQRVVFQEWKKDVPWAHAGQVTVALGGDIAKEIGLIQSQSPTAVNPIPQPSNVAGGVTASQVSSDPGIQAAAALLIGYDNDHNTKYMQTLVQGRVQIIYADLPDNVLGAWLPRRNTIEIASFVASSGTPSIMAVLSHESSHAYSYLTGVSVTTSAECYQEEERAFKHQADVWAWLYPNGKPNPQNSVEREMNYLTDQIQHNPDQWYKNFVVLYHEECG